MRPLKLGGIVLCGGQSRRMGRSKAWLKFEGETFLQRAVRLTSEVADPVVVAGKADQALPSLPPHVRFVPDAIADAGPLAGVAAGMQALSSHCDAVFVVACDHPLLRPAFVIRLAELLADHSAVAPEHDGRQHPLVAVYRIETLATVLKMLEEGDLRVTNLIRRLRAHTVRAEVFADCDPDLVSIRNVNDDNDLLLLDETR